MPFTLKMIEKKIQLMLTEDPSLSRDTIFDTLGSATETVPEVLSAAFKGDGTVKINQETLDKIAKHLEMKADEVGDCPGAQVMNPDTGECEDPPGNGNGGSEAKHPCGPGQTPEKDGCVEDSKVSETLNNVFGSEDLAAGFKSVLDEIKTNKDAESVKYMSEVMRKVFEVIPTMIKVEQGATIKKYEQRIAELEKSKKVTEATLAEIKSKVKSKLGLSETLSKLQNKQESKGLYEQNSKGNKDEPEKHALSEMSLSETMQEKPAIPNFD